MPVRIDMSKVPKPSETERVFYKALDSIVFECNTIEEAKAIARKALITGHDLTFKPFEVHVPLNVPSDL